MMKQKHDGNLHKSHSFPQDCVIREIKIEKVEAWGERFPSLVTIGVLNWSHHITYQIHEFAIKLANNPVFEK